MILTSYLDESGTHGESSVTIMAGIMGHAAQWRRFQSGLDHLKAKHGFRICHAKDLKARSGEFKGWSVEKCLALTSDLSDLAGEGLMCGSILTVENAQYNALYRNGEGPRKLRLDTKYALCFRLCLVHMVSETIRRLGHSKEKFSRTRLNVVMESGHPHAGDAARAFHEEMTGLERAGCNLLAGITFAPKGQCDPMMVADFLAYTAYQQGAPGFPDIPNEDLRLERRQTSLTHLGFDPGGLAELKEYVIRQWEAKRRRPSALTVVA